MECVLHLEETSGWHSITGRFISVMGAINCCANKKTPEGVAPSAHLADGCIDLVVVRHTSRVQYLHHMIRLAGRTDHVSITCRGVRISFSWGGGCSFKITPTHRSIDDILMQPKFVG